jgi:hypothetical protein
MQCQQKCCGGSAGEDSKEQAGERYAGERTVATGVGTAKARTGNVKICRRATSHAMPSVQAAEMGEDSV